MDVEWARMSWELEVDECVLPSARTEGNSCDQHHTPWLTIKITNGLSSEQKKKKHTLKMYVEEHLHSPSGNYTEQT